MTEITFLPYPAYGHMTPVLPVVAELVRRGHRVTCFTSGEFAERVVATGAHAVPYGCDLSTAQPDITDADEAARAPLHLLEDTMGVLPAVERAFERSTPDLLVYDTTLWAPGRLLARKGKLPAVQLSATVASNEHFSLTQENQTYGEAVDPAHPAIAKFVTRLGEYLADHGLGALTLEEFFTGGDEFTVVFVPRAFQPAGETFDDRFAFVGPSVGAPSEAARWQPPGDGRPVVLITLGTTVNDRPEFFRTCAEAFADQPWQVVLTLGNRVDPAALGPLPSTVEAHRWVSHADVLPHCSVFLCQGGMGSLMESLYFGVPAIVVPHHPEQHINARQVRRIGLGAVLDKDTATPERIRDTVLAVAGDDAVRRRVRVMQREVHAAGGAARAAAEIEARAVTNLAGGSRK
ncbi:macrolide family glycosyltransferase [Amycolatopsis sp. NPDC004378]